MFFAFFLELLFALQKRIIFVKGLKNPNAKLSYTTEVTIAAVYVSRLCKNLLEREIKIS